MPRRQACTSKAALRSARRKQDATQTGVHKQSRVEKRARRKQDFAQAGVHKQSRVEKRAEEARCHADRRAQAKPR